MSEDRLVGSVEAAQYFGYADPAGSGRRMVERQAKSENCSLHGERYGSRTRRRWKFRVGELRRFKAESMGEIGSLGKAEKNEIDGR